MDQQQPALGKGTESVKTIHEDEASPARGKPVADSEEILKRLAAIELAVDNLDERLSKLEARFIPYPGHVAGRGKKRA